MSLRGRFIERETDLGLEALRTPAVAVANGIAEKVARCEVDAESNNGRTASDEARAAEACHPPSSPDIPVDGTVNLTSHNNAPNLPSSFDAFPRLVHPSFLDPVVRISIPTVHVIGAQDVPTLVSMSRLMEGVCESSLVKRVVHAGGHHPPFVLKDVKDLVRGLEWAVRVAE